MKILLALILSVIIVSNTAAQKLIKPTEAANYAGQTVEVMGNAFYVNDGNHDMATMKIGYQEETAKLLVYLKFKLCLTLASLYDHQFVHFVGTVVIEKGQPVLVVDKLNNAHYYIPKKDDQVDSALYYKNKGYLF